jgi:hypothetical protein
MTSNEKGTIGLVKTMNDLITKNYFVFTPITDTTCVDLVVSNKKMELKRMQIKYCALSNGRISIVTSSVVNGKKIPIDLSKIDIWAIYCPDNDLVYYIPVKDLIGKKSMNLRVNFQQVMSKQITMASKYKNLDEIW